MPEGSNPSVAPSTPTPTPQTTSSEPTPVQPASGTPVEPTTAGQASQQAMPTEPTQTAEPGNLDPVPDALAQAEGAKQDANQGAPETYGVFKDVSGKEYTPESVQGFVDVARELGLSQEKAQKMFEAFVPTATKYMRDDVIEKAKGWVQQSRMDSEFGGEHFNENLGIAKTAYMHYASDGLKQILNVSGLSNHPEVIRMFYRIGKTMQQDHGVQGGVSAPAGPRRRYPKSNMVVDE